MPKPLEDEIWDDVYDDDDVYDGYVAPAPKPSEETEQAHLLLDETVLDTDGVPRSTKMLPSGLIVYDPGQFVPPKPQPPTPSMIPIQSGLIRASVPSTVISVFTPQKKFATIKPTRAQAFELIRRPDKNGR